MKFGDKVKADIGDGDGPKVGFFLRGGGDGDDGKDAIQVGVAIHALAYREPPYDSGGSGLTYCSL